MEIYVDRLNSRMQILQKGDLTPYQTFTVVMARGDYNNGITLYTGVPNPNLLFTYGFSTNSMGDIYLIGTKVDGQKVVLDAKPMRGDIKNGNLLMRQELVKIHQQRQRRLTLAEEVVVYLQQDAQRCTCYNKAYDQATPGCTICGGNGVITSHLGVRIRVAIPDQEGVKYQQEAVGSINLREHSGCFTGPFPYIQDQDIIQRASGERYFIQKSGDQRFGDEMIGQEFSLISIQDYYPLRFVMAGF